MLEIGHLKLLVALREKGTLFGASKNLHITASAISHKLKELENYHNITLVNRKTRPVSFTPAGLELLKLADTVLPQISKSLGNIKRIAHGQTGRLRLASECHSCFDWLMPILNQYRTLWSDVELDFATGFEPMPHQLLIDGDIDILITSTKIDAQNIAYLPLFEYQSRLVVAPLHPLAQKAYILPQDLQSETLISYPVEQSRLDIMAHFLLPAGKNIQHIRTTELTAMLIQLVASGRGVAALPDWVAAEYEQKGWIKSLQLGDGVFCKLFAATRKNSRDIAYIQGFLSLLHNIKKP